MTDWQQVPTKMMGSTATCTQVCVKQGTVVVVVVGAIPGRECVCRRDSPAATDTKRVRGPRDQGARVVGRRGVWQAEQY